MKNMLACLGVLCLGLLLFPGRGEGSPTAKGKIYGVVLDKKTGRPLAGANVFLIGTSLGAAADKEGKFVIEKVPYGIYRARVMMIGYERLEKEVRIFSGKTEVNFYLKPVVLRGRTLVVTGVRMARYLKDTPVHTEVMTSSEIQRRNPVNFLEATRYIPGIEPEVQCSICNASSISIHGMPGRYTQVLIDGLPLYGSLGQIYGYMQIPAEMIQQIEVIKGGSSVLYGSDAIAGIVNIRTREPQSVPGLNVGLQAGGFGELKLSSSGSFRNDSLGLAFNGTLYRMSPVDQNHDGITEHAFVKRATLFSKMQYRLSARLNLDARISGVLEERQGGAVSREESFITTLAVPRLRAFTESILTERLEAAAALNYRGAGQQFFLRGGATRHFQDSDYEGFVYVGKQILSYLEAQWNRTFGGNVLTLGAAFRGEQLHENAAIMTYRYRTYSGFLQFDWKLRPLLELVTGLRFDHHNVFGNILSPGATLKYNFTDRTALRVTYGRGFRAPTAFYELDHGTGAKYKYNTQYRAKKAETSYSITAGLDWQLEDRSLSLSGFFHRLNNYIAAHNDPRLKAFILENIPEPSAIHGLEVSYFFERPGRWNLTLNYLFERYDMAPGALGYPRPEHILKFALDYFTHRGITINLDGRFTGPMKLKEVFGMAYNADGTPKRKTSPAYAVFNLKVSYTFSAGVHVSVGVKNLLNYYQTKIESPLMYDSEGNLGDVIYIWGPLLGRQIYSRVQIEL